MTKAGGELYIPVNECPAGGMHYGSVDAEPIEINVNPKRPALRYLRRLVGKLKGIEISDEPTERVNLLYEKEGDELDVDIGSLTNSKMFDFWVKKDWLESLKFQYKHNKIFADGKKIDGRQRIKDLFGEKYTLELTHVGSPGSELRHEDEYDIVFAWDEQRDEKIKKDLMKSLQHYSQDEISHLSIDKLYILSLIGSEPIDRYSVLECLRQMEYFCECYFEDYDESNAENALNELREKGLITEVEDGYVSSLEDYKRYKAGQLTEELDREFYGLDHIADNDIISAAVLLSMSEEPQRIRDIMQYLKNRSFIKMSDDDSEALGPNEREVKEKIMELKNKGIVKETDDWFEVSPAYLRVFDPRQLNFDF